MKMFGFQYCSINLFEFNDLHEIAWLEVSIFHNSLEKRLFSSDGLNHFSSWNIEYYLNDEIMCKLRRVLIIIPRALKVDTCNVFQVIVCPLHLKWGHGSIITSKYYMCFFVKPRVKFNWIQVLRALL
jgi:hypothetical protein